MTRPFDSKALAAARKLAEKKVEIYDTLDSPKFKELKNIIDDLIDFPSGLSSWEVKKQQDILKRAKEYLAGTP